MIRTIAAAAVLLTLAGCGASTASSPATPPVTSLAASSAPTTPAAPATSSAPAPATPVAITSLAQAAAKVGCAGYADKGFAPGAVEYGTCTKAGHRIQLYRFAKAADMDVFFASVKPYGIVPSQLAVVGLVVASSDTVAQNPALAAALKS